MRVLAINSSARKDGNTAVLINTVFEELNKESIETEMVQLSGKMIEPCKACWACSRRKNCVHKRDQFQEIFEKMTQVDGIILGSPVYTANISTNMQALLERASGCHDPLLYAAKYVCGRVFLLADSLRADAGGCSVR